MHFVSFVLLSSVTLVLAIRFRFWLGGYLFLVIVLIGLWHFAYLTVAIRRFYLTGGRWGGWLLSGGRCDGLSPLPAPYLRLSEPRQSSQRVAMCWPCVHRSPVEQSNSRGTTGEADRSVLSALRIRSARSIFRPTDGAWPSHDRAPHQEVRCCW